MADSIVKFHDAAERPPQGGWHYFYNPQDRDTLFRKESEDAVLQELKRYRINNRTFVSDLDLERELWVYWCSRTPSRCGQSATAANPTPMLPLDQQPEFFGPIIWKMLNLMVTRFEFVGREMFLTFLGHVHNLMSCPDCREEWGQILSQDPPLSIFTAKDAALWVNRVHNRVNEKKGKAQYPYSSGVTEYGFPL